MKKNLIALAIAGALVAPLAAQADVSISGSLQAELDNWSADAAAEGMTLGNGNRGKVEIKATEDLGSGLTALAFLGLNATTDAPSGTGPTERDAYVGLSGGFGTFLAGTMSNPYKSSTVGWDPLVETGAQARGQFGMSSLHSGYTNNALAYANKFGPAKVVLAYVVDESIDATTGDYNNEGTVALSVNVPVGPVEVAVAYLDAPAADVSDEGDTATKIGVKYAAGAFSVAAQYEDVGGDVPGGAAIDETFTYVNGTYTFGSNTVVVAFGQNSVDTADNTYTSVDLIHGFSKNTLAYIGYVALSPDTNPATDVSALALGLRVNF